MKRCRGWAIGLNSDIVLSSLVKKDDWSNMEAHEVIRLLLKLMDDTRKGIGGEEEGETSSSSSSGVDPRMEHLLEVAWLGAKTKGELERLREAEVDSLRQQQEGEK